MPCRKGVSLKTLQPYLRVARVVTRQAADSHRVQHRTIPNATEFKEDR